MADSGSSANNFAEWSGWGGNYYNNRWASQDSAISSSNIQSLAAHCKVSYPIGVSATPVLSGSTVYYPTWNGSFVALDYSTCEVLWQINVTEIISHYSPITDLQLNATSPVSRTSPQVDGDVVYFGTLTHALIVAVSRFTGQTLGIIQTNPHPVAAVTMSPTFYNGKLFVGVSSLEEDAAAQPGYVCCSFVGNLLAMTFNGSNGKFEVLWNISMIPEAQAAAGWSGAAVWGSQPSIDASRGQVLFATGNTYSVPEVIIECQNATQNITAVVNSLVPDPCLPQDIWQESVLAIDINLGVVNWVHQLPALDAWTVACGIAGILPKNPASCPETPGPDADFGMAPTFVPGSPSTPYGKDTVVLGQKNGILHAMSAQAGELFWSTATSPGGVGGGLSWGIAVDNSRAYFTAINSLDQTWLLQPSSQTANKSGYGAVSLSNGTLLWEVATPSNGVAYGPPSVVGDLVLVAKTGTVNGTQSYDDTPGSVLAIEKATGKFIFEMVLDANCHGGIAIQDQSIFLGTGYSGFTGAGTPGSLHVMQVRV